jgi:hypothetical protein
MKLQKRYLEVSRSTREEVRAFFHFTDKRKNYEILQTSQKTRVKILRCVKGVKKLFSKKRNLLVQKTRTRSETTFEGGWAARYNRSTECGWAARHVAATGAILNALGGPVRGSLEAVFSSFLSTNCMGALLLLLPAKNKRNQPSLPKIRLHQE